MTRTVSFLVTFLFVGLMASASLKPTEASWRSSVLMGQNQGYCQDGRQRGDIKKCSENRTGNSERRGGEGQNPRRPNLAARQACMNDAKRFCGAVIQDTGARRTCMKSHRAELSAACKAALAGRGN